MHFYEQVERKDLPPLKPGEVPYPPGENGGGGGDDEDPEESEKPPTIH